MSHKKSMAVPGNFGEAKLLDICEMAGQLWCIGGRSHIYALKLDFVEILTRLTSVNKEKNNYECYVNWSCVQTVYNYKWEVH